MSIAVKILVGAGMGVLRIVYGLLTTTEPEPVNWGKVARTMVAGLISGGLIAAFYENLGLKEMLLAIFLGTVTLDDLMSRVPKLAARTRTGDWRA